MKSLADLKRTLKPGLTLQTTDHRDVVRDVNGWIAYDANGQPTYQDKDLGPGVITQVKTDKVAITRTLENGKPHESWLAFPTAKHVSFTDPNTFTVYATNLHGERIPLRTYTIIP